MKYDDPLEFLPLSATDFQLLLSLMGGELHGYAISDYGSRPQGVGDHCFVRFADGRTLNRVGTADA